jgi:DNA sulfur modification protein DndD
MILEHVTLRDFCLFRGRQTFDLTPLLGSRKGETRGIILFGGNNGTGKTTLLDAVQLALYGPRARCSKRAGLAYDEFLQRSIHHGISERDGAGVTLRFRHAAEGEEHVYDVDRSWNVRAGKLREHLRVSRDGLAESWHSEQWNQLVEDFFPLEVSQLFFFDAEKIRSLAEDETSSQVLGTAVKSLLGLDIVERLISDAALLESRVAKSLETSKPSEDRADIEREIEERRADLDALRTKRGELENTRRRTESELERLEEKFAAAGGKRWEARAERQRRHDQVKSEITTCEARLVSLAATELPLCLVADLLERTEAQDASEKQASEAEIVQNLLSDRDDRVLALLSNAKASARILRTVKEHLARDRESRSQAAGEVAERLSLTSAARSLLHHLRSRRLSELAEEGQVLLRDRSALDRDLKEIERLLSLTPEDEPIGQFLKRLRATTERVKALNDEAKRLEGEFAHRKGEWEERTAKLAAIRTEQAKSDFARDDRRRMLRAAIKTREVMREFLTRGTERKIGRLSDLVSESFRFLLRKQTMVQAILIDPATFAITLITDAGHSLPRERLSEGEKQIFAISVLWGLARASAHPLPAIIDTPMARLDAAHRRHLVERYFPHASHQVVILSTDTEVDRHYYQALQPHIARAYHLRYDEQSKATEAEVGYFWEESASGTERGSQAKA